MVKQIGAGMYPPIFVDVTYQMENKPLTLLASRKLKEVTDVGIVVENLKAGAERRYAKKAIAFLYGFCKEPAKSTP